MSNYFSGDVRSERAGATVASGVAGVILGPLDLLRYREKTFTVVNHGAVTLSGVALQVNHDPHGHESGLLSSTPGTILPQPSAGLWQDYDTTSFQSIATGGVRSLNVAGTAHKWWRLVGTNKFTPSVVVSGHLNARSV